MNTVIQLSNGNYFDVVNLENNEPIPIEVIASSLSNLCRFTGHCTFYSVAEHSVLVSKLLPPSLQLQGLLHDISECILNDIAAPIKQLLPDYKAMEYRIQLNLLEQFDILCIDSKIKIADLRLLKAERKEFFPDDDSDEWDYLNRLEDVPPHCEPTGFSPATAEEKFLEHYDRITSVKL